MPKTNTVRPFDLKDKMGYMLGDFANDFTFILSSMMLMKFYSDVMKVPVAVASFLMYASWFQNMPMGFKIFWMFFTYLLWGSVFYTSIITPYGTMASAISPELKHRTQLSTWRTMGGILAGTGISVITPLLVYNTDVTGNKVLSGTKVSMIACIFSIAAVTCYMLCYHMCTERVKVEQKTEKFEFRKLIKNLVTNKALIGIAASSICIQFGRKELGIFASILGASMYAIAFVIQTRTVWVFAAFSVLAYIGLAVFSLICWAMIIDVSDDTEVRTGVRSDGEIYSISSFTRKCGQALSSLVTGSLLAAIGYTSQTAFEPNVTQGIYNITCLVQLFGYLMLGASLIFLYPLSKKHVRRI